MGFSSKLTEEEDFLKKKYAILRKKKKYLQQRRMKRKQEEADAVDNGPSKAKQKKGLIKSTSDSLTSFRTEVRGSAAIIKNITSFNAAANTEAAKKLIQTGALKLKVENKTTFKRSITLTKKRKDDGGSGKPIFRPFSPGENSASESSEKKTAGKMTTLSPEKPGFMKSFSVPPKNGPGRFRKERKFERNPPKKGNTVYVHGYELNEELLKENFSTFGTIVNINVEANTKSAFVTFNSLEAADEAISKMDSTLVRGTRLKVSMARRQPMIESAISSSPWSTLAANQGEKGSNHKDKRALVVYGDDIFSDS